MSRGPGRLQRFALDVLEDVAQLTSEELAASYAAQVKGRGTYGDADLAAARRALRRLAEVGRLEIASAPGSRPVIYTRRK